MKPCSKCSKVLPVGEFYRQKTGRLSSQCRACCRASALRHHQARVSGEWGPEKAEAWKERRRAYMRKYRARRLDTVREQGRRSHIKNAYGITLEEQHQLLADQDGRCGICRALLTANPRGLCIDHDHDTGKVRGILCNPCNLALGYFDDGVSRLRAAIEYLEAHNRRLAEQTLRGAA